MAQLLKKGQSTITEYLQKVFDEGVLDGNPDTLPKMKKNHTTKFYNLRAVIAIGCGVNSPRGNVI